MKSSILTGDSRPFYFESNTTLAYFWSSSFKVTSILPVSIL